MGIWYQLLIEVFQAEIPLFGPILTSVFALYPWIRGMGLAGSRDWDWKDRPKAGTGWHWVLAVPAIG